MRVLLYSILTILFLQSCGKPTPPVVRYEEPEFIETEVQDSSLDIIEMVEEFDSLEVVIFPDKVKVSHPKMSTEYNVSPSYIVIKVGENNVPEYIRVNNIDLLDDRSYETNYYYLEDNTLVVQRGQTLLGIIRDHPELDLTITKLKQCNPYLYSRGLQTNDHLNLTCD